MEVFRQSLNIMMESMSWTALRRELFVDYEIPYDQEYREFLDLEILSENEADESTCNSGYPPEAVDI